MGVFVRVAVELGATVGFNVSAGVGSYVGASLGAFMGVAIMLPVGKRGWGAGDGERCYAG